MARKPDVQEIIGSYRSLFRTCSPEEGKEERFEVVNIEDANLVSSRGRGGWKNAHRPVLDLDFPATLVPSSTDGHFHLYLEKSLTWDQYEKLLKARQLRGDYY